MDPSIRIPDGFTRAELLATVDRELRLRERVYPHWVELGRMTQQKAHDEMRSMAAVRAVIAQLPETPPAQTSLLRDEFE